MILPGRPVPTRARTGPLGPLVGMQPPHIYTLHMEELSLRKSCGRGIRSSHVLQHNTVQFTSYNHCNWQTVFHIGPINFWNVRHINQINWPFRVRPHDPHAAEAPPPPCSRQWPHEFDGDITISLANSEAIGAHIRIVWPLPYTHQFTYYLTQID